VKGSGHLTAQPDAASGSDWPAGEWRPGALQRQAWRDRLLPPVEQVRPGLWSIPVPWPDSGLRYTLAYLLDTRAGVALVDTGWPSETAWTALEDGIRQAGHDLAEVGYVLVTHAHPDHLGMANRVREASGARVGMHPAEAATLRSADRSAWRERVAGWLKSRGAPPNEATQITDLLAGGVARHARLARPDVEIEHDTLPLGAGTAVRAVWTPGRRPEGRGGGGQQAARQRAVRAGRLPGGHGVLRGVRALTGRAGRGRGGDPGGDPGGGDGRAGATGGRGRRAGGVGR
jgi:hypothetical protein